MKVIPPQTGYNLASADMLLQKKGDIVWADISVPDYRNKCIKLSKNIP